MAGRKKEPVSLILAKGKSNHLTKEEIEKRLSVENKVKGGDDKIRPPDYTAAYWDQSDVEEFYDLAQELMEVGILFNLDVDTLVQYIDTRRQYVEITKALRKEKPMSNVKTEAGGNRKVANKNYGSLQRNKEMVIGQLRRIASELGLTLSARIKLVVPEAPEKPKSKFDKFGSGR